MTNNTKRTKKPCKRGKKSRTTLKRSFKKRGGSVKKQRSRAKTPAAPSSVKKRNQRNHIYEKVTNYSPTPYARLHGKKKTLKKKKGSPVYDNLQRVKGPVQPGTDTLLDNEIAEGKRGMKLKGGGGGNWWNRKKPVKPITICDQIKKAATTKDFESIRNNLNQLEKNRMSHTSNNEYVPLAYQTKNDKLYTYTSGRPLYHTLRSSGNLTNYEVPHPFKEGPGTDTIINNNNPRASKF